MATVPVWIAWTRTPLFKVMDDMSRTVRIRAAEVNDVSCIVSSMNEIEELRYLVLGAQREGARVLADLLRPAGLTAAQAEVLAVLRDAGRPLTLREIGDRLVC